ncbi:hypothetical protein [Streptomyces sp. NPDC048623]|uniref:hypothetical protein n=1 Tax=Streptomyces sp. NPDC048623 TaxID=3155761 RepID=UPI003433B018
MSTRRSLFLLIKSWRVRAALLWLAHTPSAVAAPFAAVGARVVIGWGNPGWLPPAAGWATALLVIATAAGMRLHHEMDKPGVPCRWCDLDFEEDRA